MNTKKKELHDNVYYIELFRRALFVLFFIYRIVGYELKVSKGLACPLYIFMLVIAFKNERTLLIYFFYLF